MQRTINLRRLIREEISKTLINEFSNGSFEDMQAQFIQSINRLTNGYKYISIDEDGEMSEFKSVSNIGQFTYKFIIDNYNSVSDWLNAIQDAHFIDSATSTAIQNGTITIEQLVSNMVYESTYNKVIGIDETYVLVLK